MSRWNHYTDEFSSRHFGLRVSLVCFYKCIEILWQLFFTPSLLFSPPRDLPTKNGFAKSSVWMPSRLPMMQFLSHDFLKTSWESLLRNTEKGRTKQGVHRLETGGKGEESQAPTSYSCDVTAEEWLSTWTQQDAWTLCHEGVWLMQISHGCDNWAGLVFSANGCVQL